MNSLDRMLLEIHAGTQFALSAQRRRDWSQMRHWLTSAKAHLEAAVLIQACGVTVGKA